ncbi:hypothetical protein BD626DRAFT_569734 [Schizophyllum amplum]|uniref:Uncharacterized protein n=1 Tax=Schizophyllum amplum TaxID=97359 RepID=A0A550CCQ6_9AGAR|nr:hypothetical protein BD626DRAFT_569734 [Auriculariopsis ampla]
MDATSSSIPSPSSSSTTTIVVGTLSTCKSVTHAPRPAAPTHPPSLAAATAFITGLHGIWKNRPNYQLAAGVAGLNSGITAATFFTLRELVVSPLLQSDVSPSPPTPTSIRREKLLDSGVSGAVAGTLLRGIRSGPAAGVSGGIILGTITTSLQFGFNIVRASRMQSSLRAPETEAELERSTKKRVTDAVLSVFGVFPMTTEEQIASLARKRDHHLVRIRELEEQLGITQEEANAENPS